MNHICCDSQLNFPQFFDYSCLALSCQNLIGITYFCRAELAITFSSLWMLAEEHLSTTAVLRELPPDVLRYLTQALVLASSAADDEATRKKYLDQVRVHQLKRIIHKVKTYLCWFLVDKCL